MSERLVIQLVACRGGIVVATSTVPVQVTTVCLCLGFLLVLLMILLMWLLKLFQLLLFWILQIAVVGFANARTFACLQYFCSLFLLLLLLLLPQQQQQQYCLLQFCQLLFAVS